MQWTIQDLGALGEFLGSIAVVVTLIYLVAQVRQNTRGLELNRQAVVGQTVQQRSHRWSERMERLAESEHLAEILAQLGSEGHNYDPAEAEKLDPQQRLRLWAWEFGYAQHMANIYQQYELGFEEGFALDSFLDAARRDNVRWQSLGVPVVHDGLRNQIGGFNETGHQTNV